MLLYFCNSFLYFISAFAFLHFISAFQALSPAMEQWRKRISKIAASFEANKAEISTAEKQAKSAKKSLKPEVTAAGPKLNVLQEKCYSQDLQLQRKQCMHFQT